MTGIALLLLSALGGAFLIHTLRVHGVAELLALVVALVVTVGVAWVLRICLGVFLHLMHWEGDR